MTEKVRVSLLFPRDVWEEVRHLIPSGERSRVIAEATMREIRRRQRLEGVQRLRALQDEFRQKYGEAPDSAEEIRQMREERDAGLLRLH